MGRRGSVRVNVVPRPRSGSVCISGAQPLECRAAPPRWDSAPLPARPPLMSSAPAIPAPSRLRTYASFVRFEHTLFSLPLILAGVFSAAGPALKPGRWALVALAAVGARTAAMTLNRLIDRRLDALNPRTRA